MNTTIKRGLLTAIKKAYPEALSLIYNGTTKQVAWKNKTGKSFVGDASGVDLSTLMLAYKMESLEFIEIDFQNEKIVLSGDKEIIL